VSAKPLRDRGDVSTDLVELDDAQRLVRAKVLEQGFETLCSRKVFDGQRSLAAVMAPQHPVGVPDATLALRWAFTVELRGIEPLLVPAEMKCELRLLFIHCVTWCVRVQAICVDVLRDVTVLATSRRSRVGHATAETASVCCTRAVCAYAPRSGNEGINRKFDAREAFGAEKSLVNASADHAVGRFELNPATRSAAGQS
jgi:hypothetical protein